MTTTRTTVDRRVLRRFAFVLVIVVSATSASGLRHFVPELHEHWQSAGAHRMLAFYASTIRPREAPRLAHAPPTVSAVVRTTSTRSAFPRPAAAVFVVVRVVFALPRKHWRLLTAGHGRYGAG